MSVADEYWHKFLKSTSRDTDTYCSGDIIFESSDFNSDEKIVLILTGKKTAFFSSFASYSIDGELLPAVGELYLVFDRANNPCCVIEIENVDIIPFGNITWEMACLEGEDENFEEWTKKLSDFLREESEIMGYSFSNDLKLVFQKFKVVYK